jgi:diguanylate cyclase (GGDEF)-like protein/PAS domain S-box-containing protein
MRSGDVARGGKVLVSRPEGMRKEVHRYSFNIIESSLDIIIAVDTGRRIIRFNKSAQKTFGYREEEVLGLQVDILYDDPDEGVKIHRRVCENGEFTGEITNRRKDGETFRAFLSASTLLDTDGNFGGVMGISRDITERKRSEELLEKSERFLNTIFHSIMDPFSIVDRDFRIVRVNEAYAQMRGRRVEELLGGRCYEILQGRTCVCDECVVQKTFDSSDPCAKDKLLTFPDGLKVWVEIYTYPIMNEEGRVSHVIEYTRDITSRKKAEEEKKLLIERLEYLSSTDVLTELLNRRALMNKLSYEVNRAERYGSELSIVLCDIDNFKDVNDTFGHAVGDTALRLVAEVLRQSLRKIDIAGRYGGDEFLLILPETSLTGAGNFAERIRAAVEGQTVPTEDGEVRVTLSLGVTSCTLRGDGDTIDSLIRDADAALYSCKRTGKNRLIITGS